MIEFDKILQLIKNDKHVENHFFEKLAVSPDPIPWLIPLKEKGYFNPASNPKPQKVPNKDGYFTVPHWNILDALDNIAAKNAETPDDNVSEIIVEIIDGIIEYRDSNGERIANYRTDWKLLETLSRLSTKHIKSKHIKFIEEALHPGIGSSLIDSEIGKLFLPKLIEDEAVDLIVELLDVILHYIKIDRESSDKYMSVMDSHWLKSALDKNKKGIAKLCSIKAAKVALAKIQRILDEDQTQFNYIWIPAIEDHEQTSFPDRYECQIVHFVRDMLEESSPKDAEPIVEEMLKSKHDIHRRLAYHLINRHYAELNHLIWGFSDNPLNGRTIHELFELFKTNCKSISDEQMQVLLRWIESQDLYISEDMLKDSEQVKRYKARYKKEWLLALLDSNNPDVLREYATNNEIFPYEIEHPGFHSWSESGLVIEVSPIEESELLNMTTSQIAEYINNYKEASESQWRGLERVDLESAIRKFVSNYPEQISNEMTPFLSTSRKYQHVILRGLEEAWRGNKNFDWSNLLQFIVDLLNQDELWQEKKETNSYDYNDWILGTIADLIREGTKSDKHAFAVKLLPLAERVVLILLEKTDSKMHMMNDLLTSVINSTRGKAFIAAVNYSLRYARQSAGTENERWAPSIKDDFTKRLNRAYEPSLEFSVVLGEYIANFLYLDKQWVYRNINAIFDKENEEHWVAAFTGYVAYSSTVYEEIYKLLKENGHYKKGLVTSFNDRYTETKLVQNIAIGYIAGWEDLENPESLIAKLVNQKKASRLSELVSFMWFSRDKDNKELRSKIKPLWKSLIHSFQPTIDSDEYRTVVANLSKWLSLVDKLDEEVQGWIEISLEAMQERWDSHYLVENLLKHVELTPNIVADLYLKMLNLDIYPDYTEENILAIVNALYKQGVRDKANRICNLYGSKGFVFLRETFENNNR